MGPWCGCGGGSGGGGKVHTGDQREQTRDHAPPVCRQVLYRWSKGIVVSTTQSVYSVQRTSIRTNTLYEYRYTTMDGDQQAQLSLRRRRGSRDGRSEKGTAGLCKGIRPGAEGGGGIGKRGGSELTGMAIMGRKDTERERGRVGKRVRKRGTRPSSQQHAVARVSTCPVYLAGLPPLARMLPFF